MAGWLQEYTVTEILGAGLTLEDLQRGCALSTTRYVAANARQRLLLVPIFDMVRAPALLMPTRDMAHVPMRAAATVHYVGPAGGARTACICLSQAVAYPSLLDPRPPLLCCCIGRLGPCLAYSCPPPFSPLGLVQSCAFLRRGFRALHTTGSCHFRT